MRVPDCLISMTLAGLAFGLAKKAISQDDPQRSHSEWPQFNGGYDATRFSPLSKINTNNVGSLREVARFNIPETTTFPADPVVVGGTLHVTILLNSCASHGLTAQQLWGRHHGLINPGPA